MKLELLTDYVFTESAANQPARPVLKTACLAALIPDFAGREKRGCGKSQN